jgi:hypothetical protein
VIALQDSRAATLCSGPQIRRVRGYCQAGTLLPSAQCRAALLVTTCAAGVAALICCPREKLALSAALSCLYACRSLGATYAQDDTDGDGTEHIGQ